MRVAWVIYGAIDQATGGYVYDRLVVDRLRAGGDRVDVVSIEPSRAPVARGLALARRVARRRPDVVVGDALCFRELGPAFAAMRGSIGRVLLVHHMTSWELPRGAVRLAMRARERLAIATSDVIATTSAPTAARLAREHGVMAQVALPGADRLPRRARVDHAGAIELVFVGTWIARKRLRELVVAFGRIATIPGARARLVIAGDASREPSYAREVRAAIASADIDVRGVLGDEALADLLARADALVLPSSLEGYGMVLTEALHAGVPVIASRAIAAPAALVDEREALLFDEQVDRRARPLEEVLRRFISEGALRDRLRKNAEARAATLPTWQGTADALHTLLARAAAIAQARE